MLNHALKTKAGMIVGNRLHRGNKNDMPLHRTVGNMGLSVISRVLFGIRIADTQSGMRLFHKDALPHVCDYTIDRYGFATEMLWQAQKRGVVIHEVPTSVKYSAETLGNGQNNWGAVELILSLLWARISR
jgi:hypothetical protein